MKNPYRRELLAALSLANLSFLHTWDGLLNYTASQAFFLSHAPSVSEYAAAFANVFLLGLLFFALIHGALWIRSRFGTPGLIFGTIPLLTLIALPAAKSLLRSVQNRFSPTDAWLILGTLTMLAIALAIASSQPLLRLVSTALVSLWPLIPVEALISIWRCATAQRAAYNDGPLAPRLASTSRPRIVWIIFDELDYRLAFVDRPSNLPMPAFDRLRAESLFATNAFSPYSDTIPSVPSLLAGKPVEQFQQQGPARVLVDGVPWSQQPTIFSTAHAMGSNVAIVGWYLPYCRLFSQDLASCSFHEMETDLNESGSSFRESFLTQQTSLLALGHYSLLGQSPGSKKRLQMLSSMHDEALHNVVDPSLNLVYLHLPVPHAPYLYDRFTHTFPKRYLNTGSYFDNLALADNYLGDLRAAMTTAGLWDQTTVLVSSDHPDRTATTVDGKSDARIPFILKLAQQTKGSTYQPILKTLVTKSLLEAILDCRITTPEEALTWLAAK